MCFQPLELCLSKSAHTINTVAIRSECDHQTGSLDPTEFFILPPPADKQDLAQLIANFNQTSIEKHCDNCGGQNLLHSRTKKRRAFGEPPVLLITPNRFSSHDQPKIQVTLPPPYFFVQRFKASDTTSTPLLCISAGPPVRGTTLHWSVRGPKLQGGIGCETAGSQKQLSLMSTNSVGSGIFAWYRRNLQEAGTHPHWDRQVTVHALGKE